MSKPDNSGCLGVIMAIIDIALVVGSGFLAWNWIDPDDFATGVLFILVWGALSTAGFFLSMAIVSLIDRLTN